MNTCTRQIQFCAGHRVLGHESKCAHLHGHNYVLEVEARAILITTDLSIDGQRVNLDQIGRVIDFSMLKERVGGWIETNWDHGFLVNTEDHELLHILRTFQVQTGQCVVQRFYIMQNNPTAENIAQYIVEHVGPRVLHDTGVELVSCVVHETENCKATYRKDENVSTAAATANSWSRQLPTKLRSDGCTPDLIIRGHPAVEPASSLEPTPPICPACKQYCRPEDLERPVIGP